MNHKDLMKIRKDQAVGYIAQKSSCEDCGNCAANTYDVIVNGLSNVFNIKADDKMMNALVVAAQYGFNMGYLSGQEIAAEKE